MADAETRERLRRAAIALGELLPRVAFVGGSVTPLLVTDPTARPPRKTLDVDVIVDVVTLLELHAVEAQLRARGFRQHGNEPVCRWHQGEIVIDVMPVDATILGFSNRWYAHALSTARPTVLDDVTIQVIAPVAFLATKLEAFRGRGEGDFQMSHDLEDVVALVDGRRELVAEILDEPGAGLRAYVVRELAGLLAEPAFVESLLGHVAGEDARAAIVRARLEQIVRLGRVPS